MVELARLLEEALTLPVLGWDFSPIGERWRRGATPWDLRALVRERTTASSTLVDLGTGGGEFLASLGPLPARTYATEGYPPNLPVARARLAPRGVQVVGTGPSLRLPFPDRSADVVLCRHTAFDPREVARVLRPGGTFLTQQVGGENYQELRRRFGLAREVSANRVESLAAFTEEIDRVGLSIRQGREARFPERFLDVGAVVYFLRAVPWEVPGFTPERFHRELEALHREIERTGGLEVWAHRLLVEAARPG